MASIVARNGKWSIAFTDHMGIRRKLKTNLRVMSDDGARELLQNKKEAQRRADAEQERQDAIRDGRLDAPGTEKTFGDAAELYIRLIVSKYRSKTSIKGRLENWVLDAEVTLSARSKLKFRDMRLRDIRPSHVLEVLNLASEEKTLRGKAPEKQTLKHIRATISQVFKLAIADEPSLKNPVAMTDAKMFRPARRRPVKIPLEFALQIPAHVATRWRNCFACALYTGLRKGEVLALRVSDIDMDRRCIYVGRSHDSDTTKTDDDGYVKFPAALEPYLRAQLAVARNGVLFPNSRGEQWSRHTDLPGLMRSALNRMGVVDSYDHKCRRKGCGHVQNEKDNAPRRCPACDFQLWPSPRPPKAWTFKALRSTCASLILERTGNLKSAQKQLRHKRIETTASAYADQSDDQQEAELNRAFSDVPPAFPEQKSEESMHRRLERKVLSLHGVAKRAILDSNQWPSAPEAEGVVLSGLAPFNHVTQVSAFVGSRTGGVWSGVAASAHVAPQVVPPVFPESLKPLPSPPSRLLKIAEVAARLGVHEQSVRKLVRADELAAERNGPRLFVPESELLRFIGSTVPGDRLVRISEVARALRTPESEIWRWCSSGRVDAVHVWSNTRIRQSTLDALLAERR